METLEQYEELKDLYIKYIGINERLKKVVNKNPKSFIKYIKKNFIICETWSCNVEDLEDKSIFIRTKETREECEQLANKFREIEDNKLIIKVELKRFLKLK